MRAVFRYIPSAKFDGRPEIVRTEHRPSTSHGAVNKSWEAHASKGIEVRVVPGGLETRFDESLDDFASIPGTGLAAA